MSMNKQHKSDKQRKTGFFHRPKTRFRKRAESVLACIVVFVVTYSLILPAITLEINNTASVGMAYETQPDLTEGSLSENQSTRTAGETGDVFTAQEAADTGFDDFSLDDAATVALGYEEDPMDFDDSSAEDMEGNAAGEDVEQEKSFVNGTLSFEANAYVAYAEVNESAELPQGTELRVDALDAQDIQPYL